MKASTLQFSMSVQDCWCQAILSNAQAGLVAAPTRSLINKQLFLRLKKSSQDSILAIKAGAMRISVVKSIARNIAHFSLSGSAYGAPERTLGERRSGLEVKVAIKRHLRRVWRTQAENFAN